MYLFTFISGFITGYFLSNLNLRELLRNIFDFSQIPDKVFLYYLRKYLNKNFLIR